MPKDLIHLFFLTYTLLLFTRIVLSWIPDLYQYRATYYVIKLTDPYLNIFKKLIPPIGGVLDISPLLAFFVLNWLEKLVLKIL